MTTLSLYMLSPLLVGVIFRTIQGEKGRNSNGYLITMGIILFFFFAFRSKKVGSGDAIFYYNLWEKLSKVSFQNISQVFAIDLEKGFLASVWVLSHIFPNGQYIFICAGLLFSFTICKYIKENVDDYILGFLAFNGLGMFSFFLQGTRQAIAICICLLALNFCKKRKLINYYVTIAIAMLFHASAGLYLVVYFIYGFKLNYKSILVAGILAILIPNILNLVANAANFLMNESYVGGKTETTFGGTITMILYACIVTYTLLLHKESGIVEESYTGYVNFSFDVFMFMIATAFFATRFFYISVFDRASYYFSIFSVPALEYTKNRYTERSIKLLEIAFVLAFLILVVHKSGSTSTVFNYHFFWRDAFY